MDDLSPAAQAVLNRANGASSYGPDDCLNDARFIAAAVLRAAAEQMSVIVPTCLEQIPEGSRRWYRVGFGAAGNCDRSWLSEIAAELEGQANG